MKKSELRQLIREEFQQLTEKKLVKKARGVGATPYEIWHDAKKGYYAVVDKSVAPEHWKTKDFKRTFSTPEEAEKWVKKELYIDSINRWRDSGGTWD